MIKVFLYATRREACDAAIAKHGHIGGLPRQISDGRWTVPAGDGPEDIDKSDWISYYDSLDRVLKEDLKDWASRLGLSTSGTKAELIDRINNR
ncbi:MAG TPA: hypothetical protein EYG51_03500 [Pseudomonadales bacterium]|nr:hypothetical protein [Pseudomonadales bacterium]